MLYRILLYQLVLWYWMWGRENECNNQLRNIINKIAFEYEMASVGKAYYSGNSNLNKNTGSSEVSAKITVANSESEEKVEKLLDR